MKSRIYLFSVLFILTIGYICACCNAGKWLVDYVELSHADAIITLMGGIPTDRILQTADIFRRNLARKVIIVEESMGASKPLETRGVHIISNSEQVFNALVSLGIAADRIIILPGDANSTQMEAMIIREYLTKKSSIDTLILVSSSFHTRRASMIFRSAFRIAGQPVKILCSPNVYTDFDAKNWWKSKEGIQMVLFEYMKIANFVLFERRELK
jgi:uncharacterized SAM-binding protein YcdF (DUF218 family)